MNDILSLKGKFFQRSSSRRPGPPKLPNSAKVSSEKLKSLINDLKETKKFYKNQNVISKMLISAYYCRNIAKSNRIKGFFGKNSDTLVVGSKFDQDNKHIITYLVTDQLVTKTISEAQEAIFILNNYFGGKVSANQFNPKTSMSNIDFSKVSITKTKFRELIVDSWYVDKFDVEKAELSEIKNPIISFYKTDESVSLILKRLGIKTYNSRLLDDRTVLMNTDSVKLLMEKAPYLVSMATEDISKLTSNDFALSKSVREFSIPKPNHEPIIGVFDTLFDEKVYFHEWVDYHNMIDSNIDTIPQDYYHGTEVTSIIVDGPKLNPNIDDGCGRFRVKHFGVSVSQGYSSFTIIKKIKEVVAANPDIHVWNISLGSDAEINKNFISAEGAVLDQIQFDNNVIFVIAGTNKKINEKNKRIGIPADSINSIVVNSVTREKVPAPYSRDGIVLSFFTKPDVSYYGGDSKNPMKAICPEGEALVSGTSFSAPWIARKLAYLIDILGLSREVAKALIIDSAVGWKTKTEKRQPIKFVGNGVVPVRIEDIITCPNDEIKFTLEGVSEKWCTYSYNIPVPVVDDKFPFLAKATICYFPKCSRNQGVDYTNTELDIKFGRLKEKNGNTEIKSIDKNTQDDGYPLINEEEARKQFRKWDNVKNISEVVKNKPKARKTYGQEPFWGIEVRSKERLNNMDGKGLKFGIVITLKEINKINRIDDFIQLASFKGWLVNKIDIQNRIDIFNESNQEIDFD